MTTPEGRQRVRVWTGVGPAAARRPVVFCLHGLTDSGEVFEPLWEALERGWTVVAPDSPGHGGTPWPGGRRYDLGVAVPGALHALDNLTDLVPSGAAAAGVVVLGHSIGALAAARVAAARPELVRHLILEEPPRKPWRWRWEHRKHGAWIRRLQAMDDPGRIAMAAENPGWPTTEFGPWARSKNETDARIFDVPSTWGPDQVELLREVAAPVTIVLGCRSRGSTSGPARERAYRAVCAAGCNVVHLDAGHNPRRDDSGGFLRALRDTLSNYSG